MDAADFSAISDGTDAIVEMVRGFKSKLMSAGFSEAISEEMCSTFLKFVLTQAKTMA